MQAISTGSFSCALYWKRYTCRMRSGDETNLEICSQLVGGGKKGLFAHA